ncbi:hypothetical protein NQ314_017044 [Rhamnusium bicolor]|uniref:DUF4780 domain-containing protein n=1 Tax=Rhamnusium bicolor TaxID=1586634 RepID=A0AAV8WVB4_9CUCU|nr:hypothetical protein NQ314_017044 [Rhamnusium bicolor]
MDCPTDSGEGKTTTDDDNKDRTEDSAEAHITCGFIASVETMRLKYKKISGAQKRRLRKEAKIAAGTWTTEKPCGPHKNQESASLNGDNKRPHSDSSTPPVAKQAPKRHRSTNVQTVSYRDAVTTLKMAVIQQGHPDVTLNQEQGDLIQARVIAAIDAIPEGERSPQFHHSKFEGGILWMTCANLETRNWLLDVIQKQDQLWEGAALTVVEASKLPKRPKVLVWIPDTGNETIVRTRIRKQNPDLAAGDWLLLSRKVDEKGQTLAYSIDEKSFRILERAQFKAFWCLGKVTFRNLKKDQHKTNEGGADQPSL